MEKLTNSDRRHMRKVLTQVRREIADLEKKLEALKNKTTEAAVYQELQHRETLEDAQRYEQFVEEYLAERPGSIERLYKDMARIQRRRDERRQHLIEMGIRP